MGNSVLLVTVLTLCISSVMLKNIGGVNTDVDNGLSETNQYNMYKDLNMKSPKNLLLVNKLFPDIEGKEPNYLYAVSFLKKNETDTPHKNVYLYITNDTDNHHLCILCIECEDKEECKTEENCHKLEY